MKVEFIKSLISNVAGHRAGDVADLDEQTAKRYIQAGIAKPVQVKERAQSKPKIERAVQAQEVQKPKRRGRRRKAE